MEFTNEVFAALIVEVAKLTGTWGAEALKGNKIATHIASISYVSGSEDPDRFAAVNLAIYLAGTVSSLAHYRASDADSLDSRLAFFRFGQYADPAIVETGMDILKLVMLKDYQTDQENDTSEGKQNPFTAGVYSQIDIDHLKAKIDASEFQDLYSILNDDPLGWD